MVRSFLDSVKHERLAAMWRLSAMTGMRRGEVLGLRWKDIDLDAKKLSVHQAVVLVDHQITISPVPKTDSSRRTISLDDETVALLRSHHTGQLKERMKCEGMWPDGDLAFTAEMGDTLNPERVTKWFEQRRVKTDLPKMTLHGLRHAHATALLRAGVPIAVVSKRLGHKNVGVTLGVYAHVLPGDDEAAADDFAELVDGTGRR
jgi:integrase